MTVWISRGGREGQFEKELLDHSVIVMAWETIPGLSRFRSEDRAALKHFYSGFYPEGPEGAINVHVSELYAFLKTAKIGDLVVVPFQTRDSVAIGEITGDYAYRPELIRDAPHIRPVHWLQTGISKARFHPDLRSALGTRLTFSRSHVPSAERRFRQIALATR